MGVIDSTVRTPDGRNLRVQEGGDSRGRPVLVHGGTPTSRNLYRPHLEVALEQGIRLISYDRPGYGGSTPHFGRSIADCAADVRTIADALDIDRFAIWGISGGGPHALACAARLPDRLVAAASLASPAPYDAPGLDDFPGMGELNVDDAKLMPDDPTAAKANTVSDREGMLTASAGRPPFPDAFDAHRVVGTGRDSSIGFEHRQVGGGGEEVGREVAGQQLPVLVVDDAFVERLGEPLRDRAVHLAVDDHRIDHRAAVVDRDVTEDGDRTGLPVDVDLREERAKGEDLGGGGKTLLRRQLLLTSRLYRPASARF